MGIRFAILIGVTGLIYGGILFRLYDVQIINRTEYAQKAEAQTLEPHLRAALRGLIFFTGRDGNRVPAVFKKDFSEIYAVPNVIEDPLETSRRVAPIVGMDEEVLYEKLSKSDSKYSLLLRKASDDAVRQIKELETSGIYVQDVPGRFYQYGSEAAHVLGFVGPSAESSVESGKYGIEKMYESSLAGENSERGEDIQLTIDPEVQAEAEHILRAVVEKYGAHGGSVIVQDPHTGKILAMESISSFDPNDYKEFDISSFQNPAVEKNYEPGSVMKVITMAAGIDSGAVTPETTFYDSGELSVSGETIHNWDLKGHGTVTMRTVIEESINTGAAFAEREMGHDAFRSYLTAFGFGEKTGIDLPGELSGDIKTLQPKSAAINYATAAFGQGISVTPLQMINAFSAIANGGTLMRPYINAAFSPEKIRTVISERTARQITDIMVSAVDKAKIAKIEGFKIAGKTGTAQIPDLISGGYTNRVMNTYIGFAPATNPKFVILIKLNDPPGAPLAGLTVVPAFRDLAQFLLNHYNVIPDRIE